MTYILKSWLAHGAVTAVSGLPGLVAGDSTWAIATAICYAFREVRQHEKHGTHGFLQWLDRIMDAAVPIGVAMLYAAWLG